MRVSRPHRNRGRLGPSAAGSGSESGVGRPGTSRSRRRGVEPCLGPGALSAGSRPLRGSTADRRSLEEDGELPIARQLHQSSQRVDDGSVVCISDLADATLFGAPRADVSQLDC